MAERSDLALEWVGRLVRVLLVFRGLVLWVTVLSLPAAQRTPSVGLLTMLAAAVSMIPLLSWSRIAPTLSRHPGYLAVEVLLSSLILAAAGARSPFFYFTLGTAALAGVVYGRRGAIPFSLLLMVLYEFVAREGLPNGRPVLDGQHTVLMPLLYPLAVAAGIAARGVVERGVASELALQARTQEVTAERERLRVAREMHDSLAKTVEGLAMSASVLPRRCERDPAAAVVLARQLAADATQAAREARLLMADLRPQAASELSLVESISQWASGFTDRSQVVIDLHCTSAAVARQAEVGGETQHELLRILGEAVVNAESHGHARHVSVNLDRTAEAWRLEVADDGTGVGESVDLERLQATGHFGVTGMHERARAVGGSLALAPGSGGGTVVTVELPVAPGDAVEAARRRPRWPRLRRRGAALAGVASAELMEPRL